MTASAELPQAHYVSVSNPPEHAGAPRTISILERTTARETSAVIHHPPHYTSHPSGVECITITRHMNFNLGNAIKYIWRAGSKGRGKTIEDLEKAQWYLQDEIIRLKTLAAAKESSKLPVYQTSTLQNS